MLVWCMVVVINTKNNPGAGVAGGHPHTRVWAGAVDVVGAARWPLAEVAMR